MSNKGRTWLKPGVWAFGCFLLTAANLGAGEKDEIVSVFKAKPIELTVKDGKATYTGELSDDDPVVRNHFYKIFTVKLEAGKVYRIDHRSKDPKFDAYLLLEDAGGKKIAVDDDSGGGLNSRIVHKASKTDVYRIIATTLPANQTGKFTVEVSLGDAKDIQEAALADRIANLGKSTPAELKQFLQEYTKRLQAKAADLTINDARQAYEVGNALEDVDGALARDTLRSFGKVFGDAENKAIAGVAREFESAAKKLDMLGKGIEIAGKLTNGKEFDLKKLKGKVVLVDFWATWCGPCVQELPNMEKAYAKYHKKGFDIIGISLDQAGDDEKLARFMENRRMPWPCISIEDSQKLADKFGVNSIPFPVLVDAEGRVVSLRARGPQLDILLERLLGEKN